MSEKTTSFPPQLEADSDLIAVRKLIDQSNVVTGGAGQQAIAHHIGSAPADDILDTTIHAPQDTAPKGRRVQMSRLMSRAVQYAKTYRPKRKVIMGTSGALIVLLYPVAVMGWLLVIGILCLALYLIIGQERFWRGIIALFQAYAKKRPGRARVLKVRAYLVAKRWDRAVDWLPDGLADVLRAPDLRAIVAADARHDAVLSDRLGRLHTDRAI